MGIYFCKDVLYFKAADHNLYQLISEEVAMIMAFRRGDSKYNDCQEGVFKCIQMPEGRLQ
jgi:hypothetical protein